MGRLLIQNAEQLSIDSFLEACREAVYVPLTEEQCRSVSEKLGDVTFRKFSARSGELLNSSLFAASDTDRERTRWYSSDEDVPMHERTPITFSELLQRPVLFQDYLEMLSAGREDRPEREYPQMITLHCSTCDARWLLDGNHGFARIIESGIDREVLVTEMTSPRLQIRGCSCDL